MNRTSVAAAFFLVFSLTACNKPMLTPQEKRTVNALTSHLSTHCVGRYLIDMPADVLTFGNATIQGVAIEAKAMSIEEYRGESERRKSELLATKSTDKYPFLFEVNPARGKNEAYFIHRGLPGADPGNRVIEAYKWSLGYRIKMRIEGSDFTYPDQTDDPIVKMIPVKNDMPYKKGLVLHLLERVRGRADTDIPTEPGVCFLGGFLPSKAGSEENLFAHFVLHDKHDVSFVLETDSDISEPTSLLERGQAIHAAMRETEGGRTVRKGAVNLPGIQAEEWLLAGLTPLKTQGHNFRLEGNSKIGSAQTPLVGLDLRNGWPSRALSDVYRIDNASLTEAETLALWDVVSRTLRPRPNGF